MYNQGWEVFKSVGVSMKSNHTRERAMDGITAQRDNAAVTAFLMAA